MPATAAPPAPPAAAPKPATPAPAPAKPAAPAAAPPAPPPDKSLEELGEYGADLDKLSEEHDAAAAGRKPAPKPAAKTPEVKAPEVAPKPGDEPSKPDEATPAEPPEPVKLSDLRSAYTNLKKKVKEEYEPKLQQVQALEAKVKEMETANPPEVKALQERLTAAEKRRDELESEITFVNYSKSKEYREKYERPYQEAWRDALADLGELTVEDEAGNTRKAEQKDLVELANLPLGEARKRANAMFGDSADDIMAHRRKIIDLSNAQAKALEDARTAGVERAKTSEAERKANGERTVKMWTEANTAIVQKWPKMFGPVEGDAEGNALLTKGEAMADRLFSPTPETQPKTPEEAIQLHALIRNKVRNHDRLALWLKNANAKIKELETALAQFEQSSPNGGLDGGAPSGGALKSELESAKDEIDALSKKGPSR